MIVKSCDAKQRNDIKTIIANSLKENAPEPQQGFFDNFAEFLISEHHFFYKFKNAFVNLLIVLKKASPGDTKLFKVQPKLQNHFLQLIYDSFFSIWDIASFTNNDDNKILEIL